MLLFEDTCMLTVIFANDDFFPKLGHSVPTNTTNVKHSKQCILLYFVFSVIPKHIFYNLYCCLTSLSSVKCISNSTVLNSRRFDYIT